MLLDFMNYLQLRSITYFKLPIVHEKKSISNHEVCKINQLKFRVGGV